MLEDLNIIKILTQLYSPKHFKEVCTFDLYKRCASFVSTRCFGWGLPTTVVAPIADCFNHGPKSNNRIDFINKRFHLQGRDDYDLEFDFSKDCFRVAERK